MKSTIYGLLGGLLIVTGVSQVGDGAETGLDDRKLFRFEFDNDLVGDSDDFFSAGWSLQLHHPAASSWDDLDLVGASDWITSHVPGLSSDGDVFVRRGWSIGQVIQTPSDLSETELIVDDVPYAGTLGLSSSWTVLNDDKLNAFQIYIGMVGPASFAEEVQTFVHVDLDMGSEPMGWDNQIDNEPLFNLNYLVARKLARTGDADGLSADLSAGGSVALGNFFTSAQCGLQGRFGWNVPGGFTHAPDLSGRGIALDPTLEPAGYDKTRFYFTAIARGTAVAHTVLLDGNLDGDSHSTDYEPTLGQVITGMHYSKGSIGAHFNVYLTTNPAEDTSKSDLVWANLSVDYRF